MPIAQGWLVRWKQGRWILLAGGALLLGSFLTRAPQKIPDELKEFRNRLHEYHVDLNRGSWEELELLPGIGPVRAKRIVEYRDAHGPFGEVEDLTRVHGISEKTVQLLRRYATVSPEGARSEEPPRVK